MMSRLSRPLSWHLKFARAAALCGLLGLISMRGSHAAPPALSSGSAEEAITFLVTSDVHYDAFENEDRNDRVRDTLRDMNGVTGTSWPDDLGGGPIDPPRGVLVLGDLLDDGDRIFQGKVQGARQWELFAADFGLDGTDGLLKFPVFEGVGNHDGPPQGREKSGFSFQAELKKRNALRKEKGLVSNISKDGLHYSWDWGTVHFVQVNLYPADRPHPAVKYSPEYHDPQEALSFLVEDLASRVGRSSRPVVVASHYGFDCDWWHVDDWKALHEALRPYKVVLYLHGHTGTKVYEWKPEGAERPLTVVNTGQTENGFFVVQITGGAVRLAYRVKAWRAVRSPEGANSRTWEGKWQWGHLLKKKLPSREWVSPGGVSPQGFDAGRVVEYTVGLSQPHVVTPWALVETSREEGPSGAPPNIARKDS
jgi:hypothetical protein